jgi:hypothetical protein
MLGLTLGFAGCAVSHVRTTHHPPGPQVPTRTTPHARRTSSSDEHQRPPVPASRLALAAGLATSICGPPSDWHWRPASPLAWAAGLPTGFGGRHPRERWHSDAHIRAAGQSAGARRRTRFWPPPENLRARNSSPSNTRWCCTQTSGTPCPHARLPQRVRLELRRLVRCGTRLACGCDLEATSR